MINSSSTELSTQEKELLHRALGYYLSKITEVGSQGNAFIIGTVKRKEDYENFNGMLDDAIGKCEALMLKLET